MTILVTGATGFLGSALVRELLRQKQVLHALATRDYRETWNPACCSRARGAKGTGNKGELATSDLSSRSARHYSSSLATVDWSPGWVLLDLHLVADVSKR